MAPGARWLTLAGLVPICSREHFSRFEVRQNAYVYYKAGVPALSAGSETRDPVRRAVRADRRAPWPVCRRVRVALPRAGGALRVWAR